MTVDFYKTKWSSMFVAPKYRIKAVRIMPKMWLIVIDFGRWTWQWRIQR